MERFRRATTGVKPLRAALLPVAGQVVELAKARVPFRTGQLRDSLQFEPIKSKPALVVGATGAAGKRAHLTEFGTRHHAAQPFLRPAVDQVAPGAALTFTKSYRPVVAAAARQARLKP